MTFGQTNEPCSHLLHWNIHENENENNENATTTEFQEAFSLFDNRGDGKISVSQLGDVLRALGQNPTEAEVKKCCSQLKADERIAFDVFLPILQSVVRNKCSDSAEDFIEGLRHFDKDGSGYISSAELRHLLTTLGSCSFVRSFVRCSPFTSILFYSDPPIMHTRRRRRQEKS